MDQLAALGEATQEKKTELTAEDIDGLSQNRYLLYAKVGHIYSRTPEESVYKVSSPLPQHIPGHSELRKPRVLPKESQLRHDNGALAL